MRAAWERSGKGAGVAGVAFLLLVPVGCGGDAETADGARPAVSGVVLDGPGGDPVTSQEVELVIRPAAMGSGNGAGAPAAVDRATTDGAGTFVLDAALTDLTPHAGADGRVRVEVRPAGGAAGTITAVRLDKDQQTGVTRVVETTDVMLELHP